MTTPPPPTIVHCLTTTRNVDRQTAFRAAWEAEGLAVQFHFAPDFRDFPPTEFPRVMGLTCCLIGHLQLWRDLSGQPGFHLIAEDDAAPRPGILDVAREACTHVGFQVIKLCHFEPPNEPGVHPIASWISTTCYLVQDTVHLYSRRVFIGSPDRLLSHASRATAGVWPVPVIHIGAADATIPSW